VSTPASTTSPTSIQWLFILLGLGALAIAQPLFTVFGDAPELFVFYGADRADLWILAIVGVMVVPALIWTFGWLVGRVHPRAGSLVHLAGATLLAAALGVQLARALDIDRSIVLAAAGGLAGLVAWFALSRVAPIREWAMVLAPAGLVFAGLFLWTSAPARAIDGAAESSDPIRPTSVADDVAPLAILVLDELPSRSIVTAEMELDDSIVPNLAAFAQDATWYRGHTTVADHTTQAIPALFTGRYAETTSQDALWFDHPESLFRLLATTHSLQVSEAITQICPPSICRLDEGVDVASTEPAWRRLLGDAREVVLQRAWPWSDPRPIGLDRFADTDGGFPAFEGQGAVDVLDPIAKFFGLASSAQPGRFAEFLESMEPGEDGRPPAYIFHLVLPHQPWLFRGDGTQREEVDSSYIGYEGDEVLNEPFAVSVGRSHHLDQTAYTDALVGAFLGRLEEIGMYDDAMVVIAADHGISFVPGTPQRAAGAGNEPEILPTPLLVKPPGRVDGEINDEQVELVDIAGLISEQVGVGIPWEIDSVPIGGRRGDASYMAEQRGPMRVDHERLMTDLAAAASFDQSPERLLSEAGMAPDQAVVIAGGEPIPVPGPLEDVLLAVAPEGAEGLGLLRDGELVATGMAAGSGKVVVPLPDELWGTSPEGLQLVPITPGPGD
jgi:hypothetical protein